MAQNPVADSGVGGQPTDPIRVTAGGAKQLQDELSLLEKSQRPMLETRLRRTRLLLAPSDSAVAEVNIESDLKLAKQRIAELESMLARVQIIGEGPVPETVQPGFGVTVAYDDGDKAIMTLVWPLEADLTRNYVAVVSPVGRALLGKPVGAKVKAEDGPDSVDLTVVSIEKAPVGGIS